MHLSPQQPPICLALLGLGALCLLAQACNPAASEGLFDADEFIYGNCEQDVLPWEPGFYTVDQFEDTIHIRLQDVGGGVELTDGIFLRLSISNIESNLRRPILLGLPDQAGNVNARAIMGFYNSCPLAEVTPELIGTITFQSFEPENDGQISAIIDAPTVIDARTGDLLGVNLTGEFKFKVQKGRPYTNFTGPGNESL